MATQTQIENARRGGGRQVLSHKATLTLVTGQVGVTAAGSITGGSGGANGTFTVGFTGGTVATGGAPATGTFTVASGAVSAITITSPGQYTVAPTGFDFTASTGLSGASSTPTCIAAALFTFPNAAAGASFPPGTRVLAMRPFTGTAISGSPTNINISVGNAYLDASYVAAVDLKAQAGGSPLTLVGAGLNTLRNLTGPLCVTCVAVGGTNPAGTIEVDIEYAAANT